MKSRVLFCLLPTDKAFVVKDAMDSTGDNTSLWLKQIPLYTWEPETEQKHKINIIFLNMANSLFINN